MKTKRKVPVFLRVALVLLCLVMISTHFTAGMFARYVTRANGGDAGRIAGFAVSAEADPGTTKGESDAISILYDPTSADNGKAEYSIVISNPGNTAVRYTAVVKMKNEADEGKIAVKDLDGNEKQEFSGELAPGEKFTEVIVLDMSGFFDSTESGLEFQNDVTSGSEGTIPFEVVVTFTQIS